MSVESFNEQNPEENQEQTQNRMSMKSILGWSGIATLGILLTGVLVDKIRDNSLYRARMDEQVATAITIIKRDWPIVQATMNTLCPTERLYNLPNPNYIATIGTVRGEAGNFGAPTESLRNCIIATQIDHEQRCITVRRAQETLTRLHTAADTANNFTGVHGSQKRWFYSVVRATEFLDEAVKNVPTQNTCPTISDAGVTITTTTQTSAPVYVTPIRRPPIRATSSNSRPAIPRRTTVLPTASGLASPYGRWDNADSVNPNTNTDNESNNYGFGTLSDSNSRIPPIPLTH